MGPFKHSFLTLPYKNMSKKCKKSKMGRGSPLKIKRPQFKMLTVLRSILIKEVVHQIFFPPSLHRMQADPHFPKCHIIACCVCV